MSSCPRLTVRSEGLIELSLRRKPDVKAYRFSAANTLDQAFASPTTMFTVASGALYKSKSIVQKGWQGDNHHPSTNTVVRYNPEDFWTGGSNLPHDAHFSYVRVEEQNTLGVFRPAGPILIVPNPTFMMNTRPSLVVSGTAPNVAATTIGVPPDGVLRFNLPRFSDSTTVVNTGGASLFLSFNSGMPELEIPNGGSTFLPDGAITEVFIRGNGAPVVFTMFLAVVNAEMA